MSSGVSGVFHECAGCHKSFKRLSTHIALTPTCSQVYATTGQQDDIPPDAGGESNVPTRRSSTRRTRLDSLNSLPRTTNAPVMCNDVQLPSGDASVGIGITIQQQEDVHNHIEDHYENGGFASLDEHLPWSDDDADTSLDKEGDPNKCVMKLYEELLESRANPFGLDRFTREEKVHIELLHVLQVLNAPLIAFNHVLKWAAQANDSGHVFKVDCQPSRKNVVQKLYCRYNMKGLIPKEKLLYLPYTKRTVSMIYFDASQVFASLLSCPFLNRDENFLFHEHKDPFVAPSRSGDIGDINTGRCYRETYKALVKNRGVDMILPTIFAMDKTQVDTYGRMQMEPMTMSHGLLKHDVRSKHSAMRILGYICQFPAHKPTSKKGANSAVADPQPTDLPDGTVVGDVSSLKQVPNVSWSTYLLNEMHMQIKFILEESGYLELQRNGFKWMLHYAGKVHPIVLHPYIPFIIGDTEGHDRLCGHYTARFSSIKQLCRVCECPTLKSGWSKAKYCHRKPAVINKLVKSGDLTGLKDMSQNYLVNGFDQARFGLHNARGIFGACPGEMLHLISLGWFKYCLDAFCAQAGGSTSLALKQYDSLCASIGKRLSRHSDRDLPRINFPKGFSSGANLMGHEITGCLLVKLFAFHTSRFRQIFSPPNKKSKKLQGNNPGLQRLSNAAHIEDWKLIVSSLLQWHQWMKQPTISKSQVRKSHCAVQWLMRQVGRVAPRPKGMGSNTIKTHLVLHLSEDILDHGVPENVNSAYAESAHIPLSKITARNTQKRASTFTLQAANRYIENLAIAAAWRDMQHDIMANKEVIVGNGTGGMAGNGDATPTPDNDATPTLSGTLCGRGYRISWSAGDPSPSLVWNRTYPTDNLGGYSLSPNAMSFLGQQCLPHMTDGKLPCFTEFICVNGHKYRAHPSVYNGKPWNDHAMVKWHGYTYPLPAIIHAFVDLRQLPPGARINLRESGQPPITVAGVYAVIGSFSPLDNERDYSNSMIGHYKLDRNGHEGSMHTVYMVDANNLVAPTVGIRDVGGRSEGLRVEDEHYLFLFRRKEDWVSSWDSMIDKCHESRDSPTDESEYDDSDNEQDSTAVEDANEDLNIEEDSNNNEADDGGADEEEEASDDNNSNEGGDGEVSDEEDVCPPPMRKKKKQRR
jgi:Plavaka transposase